MKSLFLKFKHLFDPIDLTEGKIFHVIIMFMVPFILSAIFQQIYTLTDAIIVGHYLSGNELAGVNNTIPVVNMITNLVTGCASGFSVVLSRSIGQKKNDVARKSIFVSLLLSGVLCVVLTIVAVACINPVMNWLLGSLEETGTTKQEILEAGRTYLLLNYSIGIISVMFYNLINAILRAMGDSFTPFLFLVGGVLLNLILDSLFIIVFRWGVAGAAIATVGSQMLVTIFAFVYAFVRFKNLRIHKEDTKITWSFVYEHLRLGIPLGLQFSILFIGVVFMTKAVVPFDNGLMDTPAVNGYGAANKFSGLLMAFASAPGSAILPFISQNYGAKKFDRIRKGYKITFIMATVISLACCAIGFLGTINGAYIQIFLDQGKITDSLIRYGNNYLYMCLPFYPFLSYIFLCRNAAQALEKPILPFISGVLELVTRLVIVIYLPQLVNGGPIDCNANTWSYLILCAGDAITWLLSAIILLIPVYHLIYKKLPNTSDITLQHKEADHFTA